MVTEAGERGMIQVFTTAYRKVNEMTLTALPVGVSPVKVSLRDKKGRLLSNGCYYLVLTTDNGRSIGKLIILR